MSEEKDAYVRLLKILLQGEREAQQRATDLSKIVTSAAERPKYEAAAKSHAAQGDIYKRLIRKFSGEKIS